MNGGRAKTKKGGSGSGLAAFHRVMLRQRPRLRLMARTAACKQRRRRAMGGRQGGPTSPFGQRSRVLNVDQSQGDQPGLIARPRRRLSGRCDQRTSIHNTAVSVPRFSSLPFKTPDDSQRHHVCISPTPSSPSHHCTLVGVVSRPPLPSLQRQPPRPHGAHAPLHVPSRLTPPTPHPHQPSV